MVLILGVFFAHFFAHFFAKTERFYTISTFDIRRQIIVNGNNNDNYNDNNFLVGKRPLMPKNIKKTKNRLSSENQQP